MPKIKKNDEFDDEEAEEDFEEDEDENELEAPVPVKKGRKPTKQKQEEPGRRFGIVAPATLKIVDTETKELVGEGEFVVVQALTDILERLERIETLIGSMSG